MFRHLLIPTDGSDFSEKAVAKGLQLAKLVEARVTGLHVMVPVYLPPATEGVLYTADLILQLRKAHEQEAMRCIERMDKHARAMGVPFEGVIEKDKPPWRGIVDIAVSKCCDLIVMAAHGRRGIGALLVGSETSRVLTHSDIPVLVYR